MSKKLFIASGLSLLLAACGGKLMIASNDGHVGFGSYDQMSHTLTFNINGKTFKGTFVRGAASAQTFSTGTAVATSGTRSATATASGNSFGIIHGPNGRAMLVSDDGDSMTCEYTTDGLGHAVGTCLDNKGIQYNLSTTN